MEFGLEFKLILLGDDDRPVLWDQVGRKDWLLKSFENYLENNPFPEDKVYGHYDFKEDIIKHDGVITIPKQVQEQTKDWIVRFIYDCIK